MRKGKKRDYGQILRKVVHLSTILIIPADILSHELTVFGLAAVFAFYMLVASMRTRGRSIPGASRFITWMSRKDERTSVLGPPTYMFLSLLAVLALFPPFAAYVAIIALSVGDTFAALAGSTIRGIRTVRDKTLAGSIGFFIPVFVIFYMLMPPEKALVLAGVGALAELLSHRYDNLTVPFVTAMAAALIF